MGTGASAEVMAGSFVGDAIVGDAIVRDAKGNEICNF
jgi:hypothetical protein